MKIFNLAARLDRSIRRHQQLVSALIGAALVFGLAVTSLALDRLYPVNSSTGQMNHM